MEEKWNGSTVVAVLGSTGTGKSKLGIELAEKFNGEIISADSIQVYQGLDVCSAKVSTEEQAQVKHHLLSVADCVDNFDVVKFRDMALPIIYDILERGKVPIIVGGTNYYIESLIWSTLMPKFADSAAAVASRGSPSPSSETTADGGRERQDVAGLADCAGAAAESGACKRLDPGDGSLYERLQRVDPETATRLHPNNTRKIQRSLDVYERHGVPLSKLLAHQHEKFNTAEGCPQGAAPRFPKACVFWIRCDAEVLDERLSRRVDGMMSQGMLDELNAFHSQYGTQCIQEDGKPCFERGLFQSIGYKELYPYLTSTASDQHHHASEQDKLLLDECSESLVRATCRYARKQSTWIRNRFLREGQAIPLYGLDSSKPENWADDVLAPATEVLTAHLAGDTSPTAPLPLKARSQETWTRHVCDVCNRTLHGDQEWKVHLASRMHRLRRKRQRKQEEREAKATATQTTSAAVDTAKEEQQED